MPRPQARSFRRRSRVDSPAGSATPPTVMCAGNEVKDAATSGRVTRNPNNKSLPSPPPRLPRTERSRAEQRVEATDLIKQGSPNEYPHLDDLPDVPDGERASGRWQHKLGAVLIHDGQGTDTTLSVPHCRSHGRDGAGRKPRRVVGEVQKPIARWEGGHADVSAPRRARRGGCDGDRPRGIPKPVSESGDLGQTLLRDNNNMIITG